MSMRDRLIEAIDNQDVALVRQLIDVEPGVIQDPDYDEQILHCAVRSGNHEIVHDILAVGADVNSSGKNGETPLHYAIRTRDHELVRQLLRHSPDLSKENDTEISPLLLAARSGEPEIADELLRFGAKMDFHSAVADEDVLQAVQATVGSPWILELGKELGDRQVGLLLRKLGRVGHCSPPGSDKLRENRMVRPLSKSTGREEYRRSVERSPWGYDGMLGCWQRG